MSIQGAVLGVSARDSTERPLTSRLQELNARLNEVYGMAAAIEERVFGNSVPLPDDASTDAVKQTESVRNDIDVAISRAKTVESILSSIIGRL